MRAMHTYLAKGSITILQSVGIFPVPGMLNEGIYMYIYVSNEYVKYRYIYVFELHVYMYIKIFGNLSVPIMINGRGGGLGSRPIFKKFHETYAPS